MSPARLSVSVLPRSRWPARQGKALTTTLVRPRLAGGANIALEVAKQQFCETTIGCPNTEDSAAWHAVFDTSMFRVHVIEDVSGVSLSGALKNIVAMAAGFVDGLELGGNTKSAILRIGLIEMSNFTLEYDRSSCDQKGTIKD